MQALQDAGVLLCDGAESAPRQSALVACAQQGSILPARDQPGGTPVRWQCSTAASWCTMDQLLNVVTNLKKHYDDTLQQCLLHLQCMAHIIHI